MKGGVDGFLLCHPNKMHILGEISTGGTAGGGSTTEQTEGPCKYDIPKMSPQSEQNGVISDTDLDRMLVYHCPVRQMPRSIKVISGDVSVSSLRL